MKFKKIITSLILIITTAFFCVGCANVEYFRIVEQNGKIIDKIVIDLDEEVLSNAGVQLTQLKSWIVSDMVNFRDDVEEWKELFTTDEYGTFALSLETGIVCGFESDAKPSQISFWLEFANWQMYGIFYGQVEMIDKTYISAMGEIGPFSNVILNGKYDKNDFGMFFYKCCYKDKNALEKVQGMNSYLFNYEQYLNRYDEINADLTIDDINFSQIFSYPDDRIYSDNYDYEFDLDGQLMYRWEFEGKSDDFQMELYRLLPKTIGWYVLGLVISAIVVMSLFISIRIKSVKKKSSQTKNGGEENGE